MKLHLPHRLQAALMAAIASVSFTTVSSATLAAGTFAFFAGQAGAEDLTHDPILTQQLDHAKKIEFGKLSLSETGAEQVENNVAKSSFGSGDVAHLATAATLGGDIVDAVLCEGYSEAGGSWQADAAALSSTLDPAATSEFVTAEGLATVDSGEPVFSTAAAAPAAATSALDLAPQQDNSYNATTATSTTASSGSAVSAPSVGGGAGAVSVGGASGSTRLLARPVVMKTAGVTLQDETATETATQGIVSVNMQDSTVEDEITRQEVAPQPRLTAATADAGAAPVTTLGNVMYIGDSITHGYGSMVSWRWDFFKLLTDNGITQTEEGINTGRDGDANALVGATYGGTAFANRHSAQSSGRTWEVSGRKADTRYGQSNIMNWLGQSTTKTNGLTYTGNVYSDTVTGAAGGTPDTFIMLLGTNDVMSDSKGTADISQVIQNLLGWDGSSFTGHIYGNENTKADVEVIYDSMVKANRDAKIVMLTMPTIAGSGRDAQAARAMQYNEILEKWVEAKNKSGANIILVDSNKGIIDVANTTVRNKGVDGMFNDGLHPSAQGELIIAGNVAKAMGLGGRTAGQYRKAAADFAQNSYASGFSALPDGVSNVILNNGKLDFGGTGASTATFNWDSADLTKGCTVEFSLSLGNGSTSGWDTTTNFAVTVADGTHSGVLNINEAYIKWGNTILYSQNNAEMTDPLRIAYVNGNALEGLDAGYYVWLGDMMIGEKLGSTAASGSSGVTLSYSGTGNALVSSLAMDGTGSFAPTTSRAYNANIAYITSTADTTNNTNLGVKNIETWNSDISTNNTTSIGSAVTSRDHTGDFSQRYKGDAGVSNGAIGAWKNSIDGNLYMEIDSTGTFGKWSGNGGSDLGSASLAGTWGDDANVSGSVTMVLNSGTYTSSIYGGSHTGANTIGNGTEVNGHGTNVFVNGGTIAGSVFGGGRVASSTIDNGSSVTVTGGVIEGSVYGGGVAGTINDGTFVHITGGVVKGSVYGGMSTETAGSYTGDVLVESNHAAITGSINGDTVTLKDISDSNHAFGMHRYTGAINATKQLKLDHYTATRLSSPVTTQRVLATGNTATTISNLTLTACDITAETGSSLALDGTLTLGNTTTYSGHIVIQDGLTITYTGTVALDSGSATYSDGANGFKTSGITLMTAGTDEHASISGTGLFNADGGALTSANTATFHGAGSLAGYTFSYDDTTKVLSAVDMADYYINSGTVYYGGPNAPEDIKTAHNLVLQPTSSATLVMAANFEPDCVGGIIVKENAVGARLRINAFQEDGTTPIVILASNVHANAGLVLEGNGTYSINSASLGTNVSLDANAWAGTVRLSGFSARGQNLATAFTKNGSWVEMNGITGGYLAGWQNGNETANIILTNPDDNTAAWKWTDGSSSSETYITFTGKWKGDGTFLKETTDKCQGFTFTGDISEWIGDFRANSAAVTKLEFAGSATAVNIGKISNESSGALNIVVSNNATIASDISKEGSGVVNLTVAAGKHATFKGTTDINGASSIGGTIYNNGAMTLAGTVTLGGSGTSAFVLYSEGQNTYSGTGGYEGSGFVVSGQYYLVKNAEGGTVNTSGATFYDAEQLEITPAALSDGSLVFTRTQGTVYYVNKDLSYNGGEMGTATSFVVAADKTFTASGANFNGRELVLNSGATLKNSATTYFDKSQISSLRLDGDATVNLDGKRISVQTGGTSYSPVEIVLGGHTLNITGSGGDNYFGVVGNATVDVGTIALNGTRFMVGHSSKGGLTVNAPDTLMTMTNGSSLVLANGNTITLEGLDMVGNGNPAASIAQDSGSAKGNLVLTPDAGKVYTYNGTAQLNSLTLDGEGTQVVKLTDDNSNLGTVTVNSGTLRMASALKQTTNVTVQAGATVDLQQSGMNNAAVVTLMGSGKISGGGDVLVSNTGEFVFSKDGTTNLTANYVFMGTNEAQLNGHGYDSDGHTLNIGGENTTASISTQTSDLRVESELKARVLAGGALTVAGNLVLGHNTATNPGMLEIAGGDVKVAGIHLVNTTNSLTMTDGTFEVTTAGNAFTGDSSGNNTVELIGGTLKATQNSWTLNHNATLGDIGVETSAGNTLTIGASRLTTTLTGIIDNSGTLALAGTMNVTKDADEGSTGERYSEGDNGFLITDFSSYTLVSGNTDASQLTAGDVVWQIKGTEATGATFENGVLMTAGTQGTEYFVNSGNVVYKDSSNHTAEAAGLTLSGGTLTVNEALNRGVHISVAAEQATPTTSGLTVSGSVSLNQDSFGTVAGDFNLTGTVSVGINTLNSSSSAGSALMQHAQGGTLYLNSLSTGYYAIADSVTAATGTLKSGLGSTNVVDLAHDWDITSFEKVSIENGKNMLFRMTNAARTVSMETLEVDKAATMGLFSTANSFGGTFNVGNLTGTGEGNLVLKSGSGSGDKTATFNLGNGKGSNSFSGSIELTTEHPNGNNNQVVKVVLNDDTVAAGAYIQFNALANSTVALEVATDTSVKGINDKSANGTRSIAATGDGTHSLAVTGEGTYSTAASVGAGLGITKTGAGSQAFTGDLSAMNGAVTATAGTLTLDNSGARAGNLASATVNGGTLALDNMNVAGAVTLSSGMLDLASAATVGSLTMGSGTLKLAGAEMLTSTGDISLTGGTLDLTRLGVDGTTQSYTLATATGGISGWENVDFTLSNESLKSLYHLDGSGNTLVLTLNSIEHHDLVWQGGNAYWTTNAGVQDWYLADTETAAAFAAGDNVRFDSRSADATVTLGSAVSAGSLTVDETANVSVVSNGNSLTAQSYVVNGTLTVDCSLANLDTEHVSGTGTLAFATGVQQDISAAMATATAPKFLVQDGATLRVTEPLTGDGADMSHISNMGTVQVSAASPAAGMNLQLGSDSTGKLQVDGGTVSYQSHLGTADSTLVLNNSTLVFGGTEGRCEFNSNVELMTDASFKAVNLSGDMVVNGDVSGAGKTLTRDGGGGCNLVFKGNVDLDTYREDVAGTDAFVYFEGETTKIGSITFKTGNLSKVFFVGTDAQVGSIDATYGTLIVEDNSQLSLSGNCGTGIIVEDASLVMTGTVKQLVYGTISLERGATLTFSGTDSLDVGYMRLYSGSIIDLRNVHMGEATSVTLAVSSIDMQHGFDLHSGVTLINGEELPADKTYKLKVGDDGKGHEALFLVKARPRTDLLWQGRNGTWTTSEDAFDWYFDNGETTETYFAEEDNIRFDSRSDNATVTLESNMIAHIIRVDEGVDVTLDATYDMLGIFTASRTMAASAIVVDGTLHTRGNVSADQVAVGENGRWVMDVGAGTDYGGMGMFTSEPDGKTEYSGEIVGEGQFEKIGTGELVLSGKNQHEGGTVVSGGTVVVTTDTALGNGSVSLAADTSLQAGFAEEDEWFDGVGEFVPRTDENRDLTIANAIHGEGKVVKNGDTVLTMSGTSTYTGGTEVKGGTLVATATGALGTGTVTMAEGTALVLDTDSKMTLGNTIIGGCTLTKTGSGTATLTGNSTYAGPTTVQEGTLVVGSAGALGTSSIYVLGGSTLDLGVEYRTTGDMMVDTAATLTLAGNAALTAHDLSLLHGAALDLTRITFGENDARVALATATGTLTIEKLDSIWLANSPSGHAVSLVQEGNTLYLVKGDALQDLVWQGGYGAWNRDSTVQDWYLAGTETASAFSNHDNVRFDYRSANAVVNVGEELSVNHLVVDAGAKVDLAAGAAGNAEAGVHADQLEINGTLSSAVAVDGDLIWLGDQGLWQLDTTTGDRTVAGKLMGRGDLDKVGSGTLTLTGDNSAFGGIIQLGGGTLVSGNGTALGTAPVVELAGGTELQGTVSAAGGALFQAVAGDAAAVLSANVAVAENQYAEFTGAGTLNVTGNISGAGGVLKTGTGTVVLSGTNTYKGDTVVSTGTLGLAGSLVVADGSTMDLNPGATLWLQDTELVTGSKLTLGYGSVLDLKDVTFTNNRADLARVGTLDAMFSDMNHGEISNRWMVEGVALHNVAGEGGTTYARLRYRNENGKTVLYAELVTPESAPSTARGVYWNGGETGTWDIGNSSNLVWRTQESGGKEAYYTTGNNINYSRSAYFVDDITANIVVPDKLDYVKDVIVTNGTYNFSTTNPNAYLKLSVDVQSSIIVRSGAEANFGFAINSGDGSFIHVEEGAVLTAHDTNYNENQLFNAQVEGTMDLLSYNVYVKRLTNTGDTKIVATGVTEVQSGIQAERISNTGNLYISGTSLQDAAADITGAAPIANEGTLTLASLLDEKSGHRADFNVYMPIEGHGEVLTEGADKVVVHRTVEADKLELDAADSVFQADVQAAESTEVKEGKTGSFMGGATLQGDTLVDKDATLVFGNAKAATTDTGYETFSYQVDRITADTAEAVKVQRGATVNVGTLSAAESTVVLGGGDVNPERVERIKATLVTSGPAVMDDLQVLDNHATGTFNGTATIGTIHQDGGTVVLNAGGSIGTGKTTGGTVSAGTLTLGARQVLDQNAVIDVTNGGTYTLTATTGHVDATDLELVRTDSGFCEIYSNKTVTAHQTTWESGFMASGNELVKLYQPVNEDAEFTLTSNDMKVVHAEASGTMTLIGTDNKENFRDVMGTQDMDVDDYVGWGYLNTSETNYLTYFIRDDYVTGDLNGRVSETGKKEKGGGDTTLSVIKTVANGQLTGIVFDLTDYNTAAAVTGYDGTLTVDTNSTADFFAVAANAEAMLNITRDATVTADGSYKGVSGTLDLQGEGVYEITDRADLGANVKLRNNESGNTDEWNGTVRIKGTSEDLNIDNMSVGSGVDASTIEFNHWSGSLVGEEHASDAYINLVGTGLSESDTAAITITGGESAMQYTWNNAVTGDYARILHEDGPGMELTLRGDTSGWTGLYVQQAGTVDSLTYMGGDAVSSGASVSDGTLNVTYGGTVTRVGNEDDTLADNSMGVYNAGSKLNVNYTTEATRDEEGTVKGKTEVYSTFSTDGRGDLAINVGDGAKTTVVDFKGGFYNTGNATVSVNKDSEANFLVDAELLRVVGDTGSTVTVSDGETLALASTDAKNSYSEFHNLDNEGTIIMKADGGSIHLVVDEEAEGEFNMGHLELDGSAGTAHVGTDATNGKGKAVVNIQDLKSSTTGEQKLVLENLGGTNEVDYRLGLSEGTTDAQFHGKIRFGSESADPVGGTTRVVLGSTNVAADAVLESVGYGNTADVVVDTANASVQGITSADGDSVRGRLYGTGKNTAEGSSNNQVTITGSDTYSYNGGLGEKLDIAYTGNGKQTFEGGAAGFSGKVTVDNNSTDAGVLEVLNAASMNITDLTIGSNNTLVAKQGVNVGTADANVTVSGTLLAKGGSTTDGTGNASRMDANLTLASGSTLNVAAAGGTGGLDLGGSLTINTGALLSEGDIATLLGLEIGSKYDLAFSVGGVNFSDVAVDETGKIDASTYFTNLGKDEYYICYTGVGTAGGNGSNVGTVYLYKNAPEPTTGTLSLLALAALCARRRRKA